MSCTSVKSMDLKFQTSDFILLSWLRLLSCTIQKIAMRCTKKGDDAVSWTIFDVVGFLFLGD